MWIDLSGRNALITGGSQGIGAASAAALAAAGASVTLLARDRTRLDAVLATLPAAKHAPHRGIVADMSDTAGLRSALAELGGTPIHILVNNSGGPPPGPAHLADIEAYEAAFRQHLLAYQTLLLAVLPGMRAAHWGRVINVISTSVKAPLHNLGVSNTVRGAVAQWAKTLATELAPEGITVNNVLPGATATGRLTAIISGAARKQNISEQEAEARMLAEIPVRRFAKPEETADAVLFLASDRAAYINGINLPVDGGRTPTL